MKKQTTIPFSGFYESLHGDEIDHAINRMFSDDTGTENYGLINRANQICDFGKVYALYAADYCSEFACEFNLPSLAFEKLNSPREYNFSTDRIFCTIELSDLEKIRYSIEPGILEKWAANMFTSRSGFHSFYSPDVSTWGELSTWDINQCGCLVAAWAEHKNGDFDQWAEYSLMEGAMCNGYLDDWVCQASPGVSRLFDVREYLAKREAR